MNSFPDFDKNSPSVENVEDFTPSEINPLPQRSLSSPRKSIPLWRFLVPLFFQIGLIVTVPAQAIYTHIVGKTVILQTAPVDPYSLLKGYYQVLSYDISQRSSLENLPGWQEIREVACHQGQNCSNSSKYVRIPDGTKIYVVLAPPANNEESTPPQPWQLVKVSSTYPDNLPAEQIAIQGKFDNRGIKYGVETYYMPEGQRQQINEAISEARRNSRTNTSRKIPFVVEVKVNPQGRAIPVSLWIEEDNYRF